MGDGVKPSAATDGKVLLDAADEAQKVTTKALEEAKKISLTGSVTSRPATGSSLTDIIRDNIENARETDYRSKPGSFKDLPMATLRREIDGSVSTAFPEGDLTNMIQAQRAYAESHRKMLDTVEKEGAGQIEALKKNGDVLSKLAAYREQWDYYREQENALDVNFNDPKNSSNQERELSWQNSNKAAKEYQTAVHFALRNDHQKIDEIATKAGTDPEKVEVVLANILRREADEGKVSRYIPNTKAIGSGDILLEELNDALQPPASGSTQTKPSVAELEKMTSNELQSFISQVLSGDALLPDEMRVPRTPAAANQSAPKFRQ